MNEVECTNSSTEINVTKWKFISKTSSLVQYSGVDRKFVANLKKTQDNKTFIQIPNHKNNNNMNNKAVIRPYLVKTRKYSEYDLQTNYA